MLFVVVISVQCLLLTFITGEYFPPERLRVFVMKVYSWDCLTAFHYTPRGKRDVGSPRRRWEAKTVSGTFPVP
jgi:hypothetical protein